MKYFAKKLLIGTFIACFPTSALYLFLPTAIVPIAAIAAVTVITGSAIATAAHQKIEKNNLLKTINQKNIKTEKSENISQQTFVKTSNMENKIINHNPTISKNISDNERTM